MLSLFGKKKLSEEKVANIFINGINQAVELGFLEVIGIINDHPAFDNSPDLQSPDDTHFHIIVIVGNLEFIKQHFETVQGRNIVRIILEKYARCFEIEESSFLKLIKEYKDFMKEVNHPSKNPLYAMSKAIFYKYELNEVQSEHFKKLNTPNPIFLKSMDEVLKNFLFDWKAYFDKYKLVEE